jgi:hypothetical protein
MRPREDAFRPLEDALTAKAGTSRAHAYGTSGDEMRAPPHRPNAHVAASFGVVLGEPFHFITGESLRGATAA